MIVTCPRSLDDGVAGGRLRMVLWFVSFQTQLSPGSHLPWRRERRDRREIAEKRKKDKREKKSREKKNLVFRCGKGERRGINNRRKAVQKKKEERKARRGSIGTETKGRETDSDKWRENR